jgi:hypothetical protein
MTVEERVKTVVANVEGVAPEAVNLASPAASDRNMSRLVFALAAEFGAGVFRGLLPNKIDTVLALVNAIAPLLEAGPRNCSCAICGYSGPGTEGGPCPSCTAKLTCQIL